MKTRILLHTIVLAAALLAAGPSALAADWSVSYSNGKFVVSRSNNSGTAYVRYRTVSISALDGKHFTGVNGSLSFADGQSSKQVAVTETPLADVPLRYRYQGTNKLYYDFEVTDQQGAVLATKRKQIYTGGDTNNQYYLSGWNSYVNLTLHQFTYFDEQKLYSGTTHYHDEPYTPPTGDVETGGTLEGYVYIDDSYDYKYKSATVRPDYLFVTNRAGATPEWHKLIGNKLYASVVFTEKEKDDGYAYVQILIGDGNTAYDEGYDPNGAVNTPVNSIYKACFELKKGKGAYSGSGKCIFPHRFDYHNQSEENAAGYYDDRTAFWMETSYLWEQKFRSESYRAPGELNNAFALDPDIGALTVRFDCGGEDNDTYGYKDLFVRWALVDDVAPTVLKDEITVNPGIHATGCPVTVSVPFNEPVTTSVQTRYILHTSWGDLDGDDDCSGTNIVSFRGNITASAGTPLTINSFEITNSPAFPYQNISPIKDMKGNEFGGDVSKSLGTTVDAFYNIYYTLNGGVVPTPNPSKYNNNSDPITLVNPTREHYLFAGWTGTGLSGPTITVTIPTGSTGDRSYTATWTPDVSEYWTGDGSKSSPYIISTPEGLNSLAFLVNDGSTFSANYFELGADIDMSGFSPFVSIGTSNIYSFRGVFDGKNHRISNLTINAGGNGSSGLFRYTRNAKLSNIIVSNSSVSGTTNTGAIVGYDYVSDITGCSVENSTITTTYSGSGSCYVGAVAGYSTDASITYCTAEACTVSGSASGLFIGGICGRCGTSAAARDLKYNIVADCTIIGSAARVGTITGILSGISNNGYCKFSDNFVINTTTFGSGGFGATSGDVSVSANHYRDLTCGVASPVSDVYTVSACSGISVSGTATAAYRGVSYYTEGTDITLAPASGYTLNGSYTVKDTADNDIALSGGNAFGMPGDDVTVFAPMGLPATLTQGSKDGVTAYWGSFYDGTANYSLGEGAAAYTMGGDHKLYRLGDDGRTIPRNTAVVIIAVTSEVALASTGTELLSVTDHAPGGNILRGSASGTTLSAGKVDGKTPYVLSAAGSPAAIGFRQFTGASIPAGKAYYLVTAP
ncbi:MAG: InlB B-repeat-containing protein [Bacteroidales bacterium]|nr:InlB B-repeat-containing protein [Bacteroidales bacterium]